MKQCTPGDMQLLDRQVSELTRLQLRNYSRILRRVGAETFLEKSIALSAQRDAAGRQAERLIGLYNQWRSHETKVIGILPEEDKAWVHDAVEGRMTEREANAVRPDLTGAFRAVVTVRASKRMAAEAEAEMKRLARRVSSLGMTAEVLAAEAPSAEIRMEEWSELQNRLGQDRSAEIDVVDRRSLEQERLQRTFMARECREQRIIGVREDTVDVSEMREALISTELVALEEVHE